MLTLHDLPSVLLINLNFFSKISSEFDVNKATCLSCYSLPKEEFWRLSHHESAARMRLKLEPSLYPDAHVAASNLRDNTSNTNETVSRRLSTDFGTSITPAVIRDILTEDEVIMLEEEIRNSSEPQQ